MNMWIRLVPALFLSSIPPTPFHLKGSQCIPSQTLVYLPSLVHKTSPFLLSTRSTHSSRTNLSASPSVSTTPLALRHHCSAPAVRLRFTSTQISTVALARMPEMIFSVPSGSVGGGFAASDAAAGVVTDSDDSAETRGATSTAVPSLSITRSDPFGSLPDLFADWTPSGTPRAK